MGNSPSHFTTRSRKAPEPQGAPLVYPGGFVAALMDNFVAELSNVEYEKSMGRSRLLRTQRCRHAEGLVTIKVCVKPEQGVSLARYATHLAEEREALLGVPNACAYQRIVETERAGYIVRPYVYSSLYDRISTRPFLDRSERLWIAFQLLAAVGASHERGVFHGDIKTENVLVTSWNWVQLVDYASFKPTYLPEDNPEDFELFFDTSGRRVCTLAPERVFDPASGAAQRLLASGDCPLTGAMDVFAAGCVIGELFLDGTPLFRYGELLAYRRGEFAPPIAAIADAGIRGMVRHMIQPEPAARHTAREYLTLGRGKVFPDVFYSWLHRYMAAAQQGAAADSGEARASATLLYPPLNAPIVCFADRLLLRVWRDVPRIVAAAGRRRSAAGGPGLHADASLAAVPLAQLVLAHLRACVYPSGALAGLAALTQLVPLLPAGVLVDRVVPYVAHLLQDVSGSVRAAAVRALVAVLAPVRELGAADQDLFRDYVLPAVRPLADDPAPAVREAVALALATLCEQSVKFLDFCASRLTVAQYDAELAALRSALRVLVERLLVDGEFRVRAAVLRGAGAIADALGPPLADDVLVGYSITFLNDSSWSLRAALLDALPGLAEALGRPSVELHVLPSLLQALGDREDFVISRAVCALRRLLAGTQLRLGVGKTQLPLLAPLLRFPDAFVRHEVLGLVALMAERLDPADQWCALRPALSGQLRESRMVFGAGSPADLAGFLKEPVARRDLVNAHARLLSGRALAEDDPCGDMRPFLARLGRHDWDRATDDLAALDVFLAPQLHLPALVKPPRTVFLTHPVSDNSETSRGPTRPAGPSRSASAPLETVGELTSSSTDAAGVQAAAPVFVRQQSSASAATALQQQLGPSGPVPRPLRRLSEDPSAPADSEMPESPIADSFWGLSLGESERSASTPSESTEAASESRRASTHVETLPRLTSETPGASQRVLRVFLAGAAARLFPPLVPEMGGPLFAGAPGLAVAMRAAGAGVSRFPAAPAGWRPSGLLVAQMHEHRSAVTCVVAAANHQYFVTGAADGAVKVWDTARLVASVTSRSRATYLPAADAGDGAGVTALAVAQDAHCVLSASRDGAIRVWRVECFGFKAGAFLAEVFAPGIDTATVAAETLPKYGRPFTLRKLQLDDGDYAVAMQYYDTADLAQPVVVYATARGTVAAAELGSQRELWSVRQPPSRGTITGLLLSDAQRFLVTATDRGVLTLWDLRVLLPVRAFAHPSRSRLCALAAWPDADGGELGRLVAVAPLSSALRGASNEVSVWDMATGSCVECFAALTGDDAGDGAPALFAGTGGSGVSTTINFPGALRAAPADDPDAGKALQDDDDGVATSAPALPAAAHVTSLHVIAPPDPAPDAPACSVVCTTSAREVWTWTHRPPGRVDPADAVAAARGAASRVVTFHAHPDFCPADAPGAVHCSLGGSPARLPPAPPGYRVFALDEALSGGPSAPVPYWTLSVMRPHTPSAAAGAESRVASLSLVPHSFSAPLCFLYRPFPLIVTASFDGVVRVWR